MGLLLSCCDDLNVPQKRKQFEKAIPVLLTELATSSSKRTLSFFIAELVEAVRSGGLELDDAKSIRFVEKCVALTCRKFEDNPLLGAPIDDWLEELGVYSAAAAAANGKTKPKKKKLKPEEKLELAWYDAADMIKRKFLPDRRRTNLIASWILFDRDASGDLSVMELRRLLHALNFDDNTVSFVMLRIADLRKLSLTFFEFSEIFQSLLQFPELEECWDVVSGWQQLDDEDEDEFAEFTGGAGASRSASKAAAAAAVASKPSARSKSATSATKKRPNSKNGAKADESSSDDSEGSDDPDDDSDDDDSSDAQTEATTRKNGGKNSKNSNSKNSNNDKGKKNRKDKKKKKHKSQLVELDDFVNFLVTVQKEKPETAKELATTIIAKLGGTLDKAAFIRYLTSPELNSVFDTERAKQVTHDMRQPLCAYFINSSHNTYLTGNQLSSNSDAEMYRRCLREGGRSVEIDVWDGPFGRPIVYHGFTRTSKISFDSVIKAIDDSAFSHGNSFPVTISFELHVCHAQQDYMVDCMLRIFGSKLARPTWAPGKRAPHTISPAAYKNKILIKSARLYPKSERQIREEQEAARRRAEEDSAAKKQQDEQQQLDPNDPWSKVKLPPPPPKPNLSGTAAGAKTGTGSNNNNNNNDDDSSSDDDDDSAEKRAYRRTLQSIQSDPLKEIKKVKSSINERLSALVMVEAKRIPVLSEETFSTVQHFHITSFSENRSRKMIKEQPDMYKKLTRRQLTRIYPHAARFDSSNFHPQEHWNMGCQMVAINWQTEDYKTRYAKARFMLDNGNCGYLLKPEYLRSSRAEQPTPQTPGMMLNLKILSAFALPKPEGASAMSEVIDPYCVAFVEGPFLSGPGRKAKTKYIDDNGFHPVWKGSGTESSTWRVPVPEMSTLVIQVWDDDDVGGDDFIGEAYIPVDKIRSGCRLVTFYTAKLKPIPNTFALLHLNAVDQRTGQPWDPNPSPVKTAVKTATEPVGTAAATTTTVGGGDAKQSVAATVVVVPPVNLTDLAAKEDGGVGVGGASRDRGIVLNAAPSAVVYDPNSPRTAEWIDETLRGASPEARIPPPAATHANGAGHVKQVRDIASLSRAIDDLFTHAVSSPKSNKNNNNNIGAAAAAVATSSSPALPNQEEADAAVESQQSRKKVRQVVTSRVTRIAEPKRRPPPPSVTTTAQGGSSSKKRRDGDDDDDGMEAPLLTAQQVQPPAAAVPSKPKEQRVAKTGDFGAVLNGVDRLYTKAPRN